jgi:hypothetical protein
MQSTHFLRHTQDLEFKNPFFLLLLRWQLVPAVIQIKPSHRILACTVKGKLNSNISNLNVRSLRPT